MPGHGRELRPTVQGAPGHRTLRYSVERVGECECGEVWVEDVVIAERRGHLIQVRLKTPVDVPGPVRERWRRAFLTAPLGTR